MRRKVGIIIAMDKELQPFLQGKKYKKRTFFDKDFYIYRSKNTECVVVNSGIGKVNATYAATTLINVFDPDIIVSTGISGGLGRSKLLELVVAEKTVQHDVDTTALGDPIGFVSTVDRVYFPSDPDAVRSFVEQTGAKKVTMACGDQFVADKQRSDFIVNTFDASACDMESGAIAQVAYIADKPFLAVRCISDGADEGAAMSFENMTDIASERLAEAVTKWLNA